MTVRESQNRRDVMRSMRVLLDACATASRSLQGARVACARPGAPQVRLAAADDALQASRKMKDALLQVAADLKALEADARAIADQVAELCAEQLDTLKKRPPQ